jgi:hypothetical protein
MFTRAYRYHEGRLRYELDRLCPCGHPQPPISIAAPLSRCYLPTACGCQTNDQGCRVSLAHTVRGEGPVSL